DLAITGRAAQFGRGVMADVSTKLLGQFVSCLEKNVLGAGAEAASASGGAAAEAPPAEAGEAAPAEVGASREAVSSSAGAGAPAQSGPKTRQAGGASDAALAGGASGTNGKHSQAEAPSGGPRQL